MAGPRSEPGELFQSMLTTPAEGRRAWQGADLAREEWLIPLPEACLAELQAVAESLRRDPLPTLLLTPDRFELAACRALMARVRDFLEEGTGLAVVDRLPLERFSDEEATALYWLLGSFLSPPVAQKWDGTFIYAVRDTGKTFGDGVRASVTRADLGFHTDNPMGAAPPEQVGLLCLMPAREGGRSRVTSLHAAHNHLLAHHPQALRRLYGPFYFDRQAEHPPGAIPYAHYPVLEFDGALRLRFAETLIRRGHEKAGEPLGEAGEEAVTALAEALRRPGAVFEMELERGQMQFLNNRAVAHSRTAFAEAEAPEGGRHLVRLWFRSKGRRTFDG